MRRQLLGVMAGVSCLFLSPQALAAEWRILPERSVIGFTATVNNAPLTGSFPGFTGDISFDPEHLETSHVLIRVSVGQVASDDSSAKEALPGKEWFDAVSFPLATFEAKEFHQAVDQLMTADAPKNRLVYEAKGTLTIRDKTVPVTLPFTLDMYPGDGPDAGKQFARVAGTTTLKRLDFGLGQGEWTGTGMVADEVKVGITLEAVSGK